MLIQPIAVMPFSGGSGAEPDFIITDIGDGRFGADVAEFIKEIAQADFARPCGDHRAAQTAEPLIDPGTFKGKAVEARDFHEPDLVLHCHDLIAHDIDRVVEAE